MKVDSRTSLPKSSSSGYRSQWIKEKGRDQSEVQRELKKLGEED